MAILLAATLATGLLIAEGPVDDARADMLSRAVGLRQPVQSPMASASSLAIVTRRNRESLMVYVTDRKTGVPAANARIRLRVAKLPAWEALIGPDGLMQTRVPASGGIEISAKLGTHSAAVTLNQPSIAIQACQLVVDAAPREPITTSPGVAIVDVSVTHAGNSAMPAGAPAPARAIRWAIFRVSDHATSRHADGWGRSDEDGRLAIGFNTKPQEADSRDSYVVRTAVRDDAEVIGRSSVSIQSLPGKLNLACRVDPRLAFPKEPIAVEIQAAKLDGRPVEADVVLIVRREDLRPSRFRKVPEMKQSGRTDRQGRVVLSFPAPGPGRYRVTAQLNDPVGDAIGSVHHLRVLDPSGALPDSAGLAVEADHASYLPGRAARLIVQPAVRGIPALLLVDGAGFDLVRVLPPAQLGRILELPIGKQARQGAWITAVQVHGGRILTARHWLPIGLDPMRNEIMPPGPWKRPPPAARPMEAGKSTLPLGAAWTGEVSGRVTLPITIQASAVPETIRFAIAVATTQRAGLLATLPFFDRIAVDGPEPIASRIEALAAIRGLIEPSRRRDELDRHLARDLSALYALREPDGAWAWLPGSRSSPDTTALVMASLRAAGDAEVTSAEAGRGPGASFLIREGLAAAGRPGPEGAETLATCAWGLAEAGRWNEAIGDEAWRRRKELGTAASGLLALALVRMGDPRALSALLATDNRAKEAPSLAHWEVRGSVNWPGNETEVTSRILLAHLLNDPLHDLVYRAARWLTLKRRGDGWAQGRDSAAAVGALAAYAADRPGAPRRTGPIRVFLNGEIVAKGPDLDGLVQVDLGPDRLPPGSHQLTVEAAGSPPADYFASLRYDAQVPLQAAKPAPNFSISRTYLRVPSGGRVPKPIGDFMTPRALRGLAPAGGRVSAGDRLVVRLRLEAAAEVRHLRISDNLPPGGMAIGPAVPRLGHIQGGTFLVDRLQPGIHDFHYAIRLDALGDLLVLPPIAGDAYAPDLRARGATERLAASRLPREFGWPLGRE